MAEELVTTTYRITTGDGTAFIVNQVDLQLITAYLVLQGYPPVKIEYAGRIYEEDYSYPKSDPHAGPNDI